MARLPWLFRTCSGVPNKQTKKKKKKTAADIIVFVIISDDFLLYIGYDMLFVLIRIASSRRFECVQTTNLHVKGNLRDIPFMPPDLAL